MQPRFVLLGAMLALAQMPAIAQEPACRYQDDARARYRCFIRNGCVLVELKLSDTTAQENMLRNGAELWFDTKGRKNKKTCIAFPLPANFDKLPAKTRPAATGIKLSGFSESINGIQNQHHPSGISAGLRYADDTLIYRAQLPLNMLAPSGALTSKLAVGIVIRGSGESSAMMPPEDPMEAGPPPGPAPGRSSGNFRMLEEDAFWCKLVVFKKEGQAPLHVIANTDRNK